MDEAILEVVLTFSHHDPGIEVKLEWEQEAPYLLLGDASGQGSTSPLDLQI